MKKEKFLFGIVFCLILVGIIDFVNAAVCGTGFGELCYGYDDSFCAGMTCDNFPKCTNASTHYNCNYHCNNTNVFGADLHCTGPCICFNITVCSLCENDWLGSCSDNGCGPSDSNPPVVNILFPTSSPIYTSPYYPIKITGTASDDTTITNISWSNNRISTFKEVGWDVILENLSSFVSWDGGYVNLEPGLNVITVNVTDGSGNRGTDIINITYNPPTEPSYPIVNLTENSSSYIINIADSDTVNASYSWGEKPNIYFLLPFTLDNNPELSNLEKQRYKFLIENLSLEWDRITEYKHPMNFYFVEPFLLDSPQIYNSIENNSSDYTRVAEADFESKYNHQYPAIYVDIFPNPYFSQTGTSGRGPWDYNVTVFAYIDYAELNDQNSIDNEILRDIMIHELVHAFANIETDLPPGNLETQYFWLQHPASFGDVISFCGNPPGYYCPYYPISQSPTGTEGYYEVYSILSPGRLGIKQENMVGKNSTILSTLEKMALGIKSKYEDGPYLFYQANVSFRNGLQYLNITKIWDYNISSRRLHEYDLVERTKRVPYYWDIRFSSPIINIGNTKSFSLSKNNQNGKALLVYAEDPAHPGYFKNFGLNSYSSVNFIDTHTPTKPTNLSNKIIGSNQLNITWNSSTDNMGVHHYAVLRNGANIANTSNLFYIDTLVLGGSYTYNISAVDFAGNINTSNSITFTFGSNKTTMQQIFRSFREFNQGSINLNNYTNKIKSWILG
jgi:hypothetical protein